MSAISREHQAHSPSVAVGARSVSRRSLGERLGRLSLDFPSGHDASPHTAAVNAAVSCGMVYHTRSLVPSIAMHALHNTTILLLGLAAA